MAERRISLTSHVVGDVTVIHLETSESSSVVDTAAAIKMLADMVAQSTGKVVLDIGGMDALDSRTMATIVSLNRKLSTQGGQFHLCNVKPGVRKMLTAFNLVKVLHIDDTEEDSIAAIAAPGESHAAPTT